MFVFLFCIFTLIAILFGIVCTFRKPTILKYNTLIGSELFFIVCWSIRLAWIESQSWGKFGPPADGLWIELALPLLIIALIVTVTVCLRTRYRWCFKDDPGFCG